MGYSLVDGSRFYGLGNEYGGILIATMPVAGLGWRTLAAPVSAWQRRVLIVVLGALCGVIAYPGLGANLGLGASAVVGCGVFFVLVTRKKVGLRAVLEIGALAVITLSPPEALARPWTQRPHLRGMVWGGAAGSVAAILLNDSGVVAGALGLFYVICLLIVHAGAVSQ